MTDPLTATFPYGVAVFDRLLKLDPEARAGLQPLVGKVLAVELETGQTPLRIIFTADGVDLAPAEAEADVSVRATPAALVSLALSRGREGTGEVTFRGDMAVAQAVRRLAANLEIDWEEQLSRFTGDIIASRLGRLARGGWRWLQDTHTTLQRNVAEYLTEEQRTLAAEAETSAFRADVVRLRQDADRLAARIARLERMRGDER